MYQELIKQLRSTVSRSKRKLLDSAADAIEALLSLLRQMTIERNMLARELREKESVLNLLKQIKPQWRNAYTDPPKEAGEYIVMIKGASNATALLYEAGQWFEQSDDGIPYCYYEVTHWMPLPKSPKGE